MTSEVDSHDSRRWARFSLRTLPIAMGLLSGVSAISATKIQRVTRQRQAVEMIRSNHGYLVYDHERRAEKLSLNPQPSGPAWLRDLIGVDYFVTVDTAWCFPPDDDSALMLADLPGLESLRLSCEHLS
jgi:hypothetical protein